MVYGVCDPCAGISYYIKEAGGSAKGPANDIISRVVYLCTTAIGVSIRVPDAALLPDL